MQICSILFFSWSILVKFCVFLVLFANELQQNSNASSREEYILIQIVIYLF